MSTCSHTAVATELAGVAAEGLELRPRRCLRPRSDRDADAGVGALGRRRRLVGRRRRRLERGERGEELLEGARRQRVGGRLSVQVCVGAAADVGGGGGELGGEGGDVGLCVVVGERQRVVVDREADELVGEADEEARRAARGGELGGGEEAERADGGGERLQQEKCALAEAEQRR